MSYRNLAICLMLLICLGAAELRAGQTCVGRTPYTLSITGRQDLDTLNALNLDIANVRNQVATVYLSDQQRSDLEHKGYVCTPVPLKTWSAEQSSKTSGLVYPSYDDLETELTQLATDHSDICHLESAGQSVDGKELWWVRLSDNAGTREDEPSICLIGTMHGDEPLGTVFCLELIRELTAGYGTDSEITALLNNTDIRIMPLMNPDGYEMTPNPTRFNANGIDLNRDFPDARDAVSDLADGTDGRQPETVAVMAWLFDQRPVLSANLHAGNLLVNYPFDYTDAHSPDDALFRIISLAYASNYPAMYAHTDVTYGITNGIVRGADWYTATGTLQDWAYLATGELHVTIETNYDKIPATSELDSLWTDNRNGLLAYMETVYTGIGGHIYDATSGDPVEGWIKIEGNDHLVFSDPETGYIHRMLEAGSYTVTAGAPGYQSLTLDNVAVTQDTTTALDFTLTADAENQDTLPSNWPDKGGDGSGDDGTQTDPATDTDSGGGGSGGGCFIGVAAR